MNSGDDDQEEVLTLGMAASIVAAYVGNNQIAPDNLPELIHMVVDALRNCNAQEPVTESLPQEPAVQIDKSVHKDYIICLEDGKKLKMLKRHLRARYDLTPDEYRRKWGLPPDYPMVAPGYARERSEVARRTGLGRNNRTDGAESSS